MSTIVNIINSFKRKRVTGGVSNEIIKEAESQLSVTFASEYKELLTNYGSLLVKGEEFLGIDANFYDVVKATLEARRNYRDFPPKMYVIENAAIDGLLILQNEKGQIYTYQPGTPLEKVSDTLANYLDSL